MRLHYFGIVNVKPSDDQVIITLHNISAEGLVLFLAERGWRIHSHDLDNDDKVEHPQVVISITSKYPRLQEKLEQMLSEFIRLNLPELPCA